MVGEKTTVIDFSLLITEYHYRTARHQTGDIISKNKYNYPYKIN